VLLIFNHPFKKFRSVVSKAARMKKNADNGVDFDATDKEIREFLVALKALPSCYIKNHREYLKFNCTNKLQGLDHAAAYLRTVAEMGKKEQDALYKELINGRRRVAHGYNVCIGDDMATGYSMFLCRNSFLNIIGVGKTRYTNLQATRFTPGMNTHKNSGNSHAAMTAGTKQSVIDFINQKGKDKGEVYATRIIRSMAGCDLREEEKGVIDLPLNTSRREMYEKYCFERGWASKSDSKGRYPKLGEYNKWSNDDFFWEPDIGTQEVCSWWAFRQMWQEHCSRIKIQAPCNDTCGECTVFRNSFRYQESRKMVPEAEEECHSSDDDDNSVTGRHAAPPRPEDDLEDRVSDDEDKDAPPRKAAAVDAKDFFTDDCIEQEIILEAAGYHVMQAKAMRA
jgi:hypothetical protein